MHWITMLGIALIAVGAFLTFFGQNIKNRFEDKHLYHSISEQTFQIDELISGNNSLLTKIDDYQKTLSEKDKIIQQLEAQISETNVIEPGQIKDEQLGARDDGLDATSSEQPANKQTEAVTQDIPEPGLNDIMAQAKSLCDEGKYDEAYKIADDMRQKKPDFGLAYFVLGTIEMRKKNYDKGEELLNRASQLELSDKDKAWVLHNLAIASVRRTNFEEAKELLEKAIKLNPGMVKSRKALELLNVHLRKKRAIAQAKETLQ